MCTGITINRLCQISSKKLLRKLICTGFCSRLNTDWMKSQKPTIFFIHFMQRQLVNMYIIKTLPFYSKKQQKCLSNGLKRICQKSGKNHELRCVTITEQDKNVHILLITSRQQHQHISPQVILYVEWDIKPCPLTHFSTGYTSAVFKDLESSHVP